jgi:hypothetical protein
MNMRDIIGMDKTMVGFYFKVTGEELAKHFQNRIDELDRYKNALDEKKLSLPPKAEEAHAYKRQCYVFALDHLDKAYTYFLDETQVGQWELIKSYDAFDKLDYGKDAVPAKRSLVIH